MFDEDESPEHEETDHEGTDHGDEGSAVRAEGAGGHGGGVTVQVVIQDGGGGRNRGRARPVAAPEEETKWGYAIAGAIALGVAAVIQFAFGGLDDEALENLPAFVAVPYQVAGKAGITIPLALLGLGLIVRDLLADGGGPKASPAPAPRKSRPPANRAGGVSGVASIPARGKPSAESQEMEVGEPIPEEAAAPPRSAAFPKIAAVRSPVSDGVTGGPTGDANPEPIPASHRGGGASGTVELATAKYLKTAGPEPGSPQVGPGGPGGFRRGRTNHTTTEG